MLKGDTDIRSSADLLYSRITGLVLVGDMGRIKQAPAETWVPAPHFMLQGALAREEDPISRHG